MSEKKIIKAYAQLEGLYETNYGNIITASSSSTANGQTFEIALQTASKIARDIAYSKAQKEADLMNQIISFTISEDISSKKIEYKQQEESKDINNKSNEEKKIILNPDNCAYTTKELNGIISIKNNLAEHISKNSILNVSSSITKNSGSVIVNSVTTSDENPSIYEFNVSWLKSNQNPQVQWTPTSSIIFIGP